MEDGEERLQGVFSAFCAAGGKLADTSTNYPLNSDGQSFRAAARMLSEFISESGSDIRVVYKFGAVSYVMSPQNDLSASAINDEYKRACDLFGDRFIFMVHWDNSEDGREINRIVEDLFGTSGQANFSGLKSPGKYAEAVGKIPGLGQIMIECKHNFAVSDIKYYGAFRELSPKFLSYGIGAGGVKLDKAQYSPDSYVSIARNEDYHDKIMSEELRESILREMSRNPKIKTLYDYAVFFQENSPDVDSYIVAPSSVKQMDEIVNFRNSI